MYGSARGEADEFTVFLHSEQDEEKGNGSQYSGDECGPGRAGHSEPRCSKIAVDKYPVEEDVDQIGAYGDPHLVAGVADALGEEADVEEGDHRDESGHDDEVVVLGVGEHLRVLAHAVHEGSHCQHDAGKYDCHYGVEYGGIAESRGYGPSVSLSEVLSYHRGHALSEAYGEDQPDHDDGVGKGDSGQLGRSQMPHHDVVRQLHQHLSGLGDHHWKRHFQIPFIKRYIFL